MEASTKKTKLTLTVRKDIIEKAKSKAKERGVSVSQLFEEIMNKEESALSKEQKAAGKLLELLKRSEPIEALPESDKELWHRHLDKKYG